MKCLALRKRLIIVFSEKLEGLPEGCKIFTQTKNNHVHLHLHINPIYLCLMGTSYASRKRLIIVFSEKLEGLPEDCPFPARQKKQTIWSAFLAGALARIMYEPFVENYLRLIPMRNLIFLSHSFLIESDIRTFSAFQDQSSAVLSMCINRLKVTSCGFQFLS